MKHRLLAKLAVFVLFSAVTAAIYANSFNAPFQFDSVERIKNNPAVAMEHFSWKALSRAAFGEKSAKDRPLGNISFALNYYFNGEDPFGYHLVNVCIHILTGFFLFLLFLKTLRLPILGYDEFSALLISSSATLVWLTHPVDTQSVTYLVQRLNSLSAMFYLIAFYLYAEGRTRSTFWPWLAGAVLCWLLALASKQNAATLPFFIFLYEWFFFQDLDRRWLRQNLKYLLIPVALFLAAAALYLGPHPLDRLVKFRDFSNGEFTLWQRFLTQGRVILFYISLFFYPNPSRLNLDHDFALSTALFDPPTTVLSMVVIAVILAGAVRCTRRHRLAAFCIFWFFGNLAIESSVLPLAVIFEHRTYLPYAGLGLLAVLGLDRLLRNRVLFASAVVAVCLVFGYWTHDRNRVWQDPVLMWKDVLKKAPGNARAYTNLGAALEKKEGMAAAESAYKKAIEKDPHQYEALNNLGRIYYERGQYEKAMGLFDRSLKENPTYVKALNNKGSTYLMFGRYAEAVDVFRTVLRREPANLEAEKNLGTALMSLGRIDDAKRHFKRAVEIDPGFVDARINLAAAQMQTGDFKDARSQLQQVLKIDPDQPEALNNLGILAIQSGDVATAETFFRKALRSDPGFDAARANLQRLLTTTATSLSKMADLKASLRRNPKDPVLYWEIGRLLTAEGRFGQALDHFEAAIDRDGGFLPALFDAAALYAHAGQEAQALKHLKRIAEIDPSRADTFYNAACMYARMDQPDKAVAWLKTAIEKGYRRWDRIAIDPDLDNIRDYGPFQELIRGKKSAP